MNHSKPSSIFHPSDIAEATQHIRHWVFDMDGTLTVAKHDFMAMRQALGVRLDRPILESIAELPETEANRVRASLHEIELEVAHQSEIAEGAQLLLDQLTARQDQLGILTRNNLINTEVTLTATGLASYFPASSILGRDCAAPKPSPRGIQQLQSLWQCKLSSMAMVGDSIFDLQAGRNAGVMTIYVDPTGKFEHQDLADVCITELLSLCI